MRSFVSLTAELGEVHKGSAQRLEVKFARDLQLNDLKQSSVILVGAEQNSPWVRIFHSHLNFHVDWTATKIAFGSSTTIHSLEKSQSGDGQRVMQTIAGSVTLAFCQI